MKRWRMEDPQTGEFKGYVDELPDSPDRPVRIHVDDSTARWERVIDER